MLLIYCSLRLDYVDRYPMVGVLCVFIYFLHVCGSWGVVPDDCSSWVFISRGWPGPGAARGRAAAQYSIFPAVCGQILSRGIPWLVYFVVLYVSFTSVARGVSFQMTLLARYFFLAGQPAGRAARGRAAPWRRIYLAGCGRILSTGILWLVYLVVSYISCTSVARGCHSR
jgi:hypothetical protein